MSSAVPYSIEPHTVILHSPLPKIPFEPFKLAILVIWFTFAVVSNWVVLAYVHDLVDWTPLPDPLFLFSQQDWAVQVSDWMVRFAFAFLCLLLLLHRQRMLLLRRVLFILAMLNSLRSLMILLTRLPSSYEDNTQRCRPKQNGTSLELLLWRTVDQAVGIGLQNSSGKMLCGDLFFSGHTAMLTFCSLCANYYLSDGAYLLKWLVKLFQLVGIPCLLLSRTHYTCDVLAAYFIVCTVFYAYHSYCELPTRRSQNVLRRFLFVPAVDWLERQMPTGRLPNEMAFGWKRLEKRLARYWRKMGRN